MTKEQLFESLCEINDAFLERSEKATAAGNRVWKAVLPLAACLCIVLAATVVGQNYLPLPPLITETTAPTEMTVPPETVEPTQSPPVMTEPEQLTKPPISVDSWTAVYNEEPDGIAVSIVLPFGSFHEELSKDQFAMFLPDTPLEWQPLRAQAHYLVDGTPNYVVLHLMTSAGEVRVNFGTYYSCVDWGRSYDITSVCGDVEYYLYESDDSNVTSLHAKATINNTPVHVEIWGNKMEVEETKQVFKEVLTCFANYSEGKPDLGSLVPEKIPNAF